MLGRDQGQQHAQDRVGHERDARELGTHSQQKALKHNGADQSDGNGRDGVRVEDLEQLDIRGDQAHELALAAALELGGGELTQGAKHQVANMCEQTECDVMVAELLAVMERPACDAAGGTGRACDDKVQAQGVVAQGGRKAKSAKGRDKRRSEHADAAQRDG